MVDCKYRSLIIHKAGQNAPYGNTARRIPMYINVAYLKDMLEGYLTPVDYADDTVPLKILCCGLYRVTPNDGRIFTNRPKGRKDYQLLYFRNGQGHFSLEGEDGVHGNAAGGACTTTVTAGQMVLFRPGDRQVYEYFASDRTEVYWVHFTGNSAEEILSDSGLEEDEQIFWCGTSMEYHDLWIKMINELRLCKDGYETLLAVLFRELLLFIRRSRSSPKIGGTATEQEVNNALRYFNEHYACPIKIEEYAASHYISACWLIRIFRQYTGFTPLQYIISLRMMNARELLLNPSYSISEVAAMVGYDDPLYFSRLFKRNVGVTPRDYRTAAMADQGNPAP